MDREILFRGKRLDNGCWAQGSLISFGDGGKAILPSKSDVFQRAGDKFLATMDCYEVDPSSIGQYTGLTDKNGVKIFEGDIVSWDKKEWGCEHQEVIVWNYGFLSMREHDYSEYVKVIGNIHDMPLSRPPKEARP